MQIAVASHSMVADSSIHDKPGAVECALKRNRRVTVTVRKSPMVCNVYPFATWDDPAGVDLLQWPLHQCWNAWFPRPSRYHAGPRTLQEPNLPSFSSHPLLDVGARIALLFLVAIVNAHDAVFAAARPHSLVANVSDACCDPASARHASGESGA